MIHRCECGRFLVFREKHQHNGVWYCKDCHAQRLQARQAEQELKKKMDERARRIERKLREAKKKARRESLAAEHPAPIENSTNDTIDNKPIKDMDGSVDNRTPVVMKNPEEYFETMQGSNLYIEVSVKNVTVIEWIEGKKRVALNKNREVRRTHAGGFSAEKFQRFVDFKKRKTLEWVITLLNRPGVLKTSYDRIVVVSRDEDLKVNLEDYLVRHKQYQGPQ